MKHAVVYKKVKKIEILNIDLSHNYEKMLFSIETIIFTKFNLVFNSL